MTEKLEEKGTLSSFYNQKKLFQVNSEENIANLNLGIMIDIAKKYDILSEKKFDQANILYRIRNLSVHNILPEFKKIGQDYISFIKTKNRDIEIKLSETEVKTFVINDMSNEIWGYYVLIKTRNLLNLLFSHRVN